MDRRMKTLPPTIETFSPNYELSVEGSNYLLRVNLPGFNRKDFSVQVDHTRKLTIKGRRQSEIKKNTYVLLDETYNLPQDSDYKKVTGKFDDGCLILTIPKINVIKPMPEDQKKPIKEIEQEPQKPLPSHDSKKSTEEREKVAAEISQPKTSSPLEKRVEEREKVAALIPQPKTSPPPEKNVEEREKVAAEIPQPKTSPQPEKKIEEREKVAAQVPQPKASPPIEKKVEEREKVAAEISQTEVSPPNEKKSDQDEGSKKNITDDDEKKQEELVMSDQRKNGLLCKRKFREEGWLDHGVLDGLIERINNKKKVILVAVVALSVGFYVSHKLRSSGK